MFFFCALLYTFAWAVTLQPANDSLPLCAGSSLNITCTITTSLLVWRLVATTGESPPGSVKLYNNASLLLEDVGKVGDFQTRLQSKDPLVSTATLEEVHPKHNGSVLMCACTSIANPPSDKFAQITIHVKGNLHRQLAMRDYPEHTSAFQNLLCYPGPPSAPMCPEFVRQSQTSALLSWTPPTESVCVNNYIITLINITDGNTTNTYNTTTNTTSMTVSDLTQGAEYSFTVAGIDALGRVGERSEFAEVITFDKLSCGKGVLNYLLFCAPGTIFCCIYIQMYVIL